MTSMSYTARLFNWFRVHRQFSQKSIIVRTGYAAAYPPIKQRRRRSSIRGCASFARYERYKEGDSEDDC